MKLAALQHFVWGCVGVGVRILLVRTPETGMCSSSLMVVGNMGNFGDVFLHRRILRTGL